MADAYDSRNVGPKAGIPRWTEPGRQLRLVAGITLAGGTLGLLLADLFENGWPTAAAAAEVLRDDAGWIAFWGLFLALTRGDRPAVYRARRGIPLQARGGARTLVAAVLVILPLVVLFSLGGRIGGPGIGLVAALAALSWFVIVRELSRALWLTAEGIEAVSPWTGKVHRVCWEDFAAIVEERRWGGRCLTVVGRRRTVLRVPEGSEGVGDFAAMCLAWLPPTVVDAAPGGRRRLERLASQARLLHAGGGAYFG